MKVSKSHKLISALIHIDITIISINLGFSQYSSQNYLMATQQL